MALPPSLLDELRALAAGAAERSYVPYSGRPDACVLLLADGTWIPGVRVECASFPLTIPALNMALTTAASLGRQDDIRVVVKTSAYSVEEEAFLTSPEGSGFHEVEADVFARSTEPLPRVQVQLSPYLDVPAPPSPEEGIRLARDAARRAVVPASGFPVGAVLETTKGRLIPGCNVEFENWSRILCAERTALGTAVGLGERNFRALYLTCLNDAGCSPCGACRQVLVELAPGVEIWMDRGELPPERVSPESLLPGYFSGASLGREHGSLGESRVA